MGRAKKSVEVEAQVIARGNVVPMMTETESEETVQYVSDEDAAREDRLVSEIRMITEQTKQVVLFNSIEIGRRLTEAKAMVKRGTWGTWLKERVDYSQRTANNFMKIYQEYGRNGLAEKSQALANLSYTQALALIDLPEDERARFAEERKAGEMALRKLQEEVRQEKEKVTAVKELANRNAAEAEAKFADELKQKDTQMAKLTAEKAKVAAQIEVLEKRAAEAEKSNQNARCGRSYRITEFGTDADCQSNSPSASNPNFCPYCASPFERPLTRVRNQEIEDYILDTIRIGMKSDTVLDSETVIDFLCNISDGGFELYDPKFEIYFNSGITYGADNLELLHVTKHEIDLTVQRGGVIFQDVLKDWSIEPDATIHVWRFPESESDVMTSEFSLFMLGLLAKIKAGTIWKSSLFILSSLSDHQV